VIYLEWLRKIRVTKGTWQVSEVTKYDVQTLKFFQYGGWVGQNDVDILLGDFASPGPFLHRLDTIDVVIHPRILHPILNHPYLTLPI
jgi:hypothetical protein